MPVRVSLFVMSGSLTFLLLSGCSNIPHTYKITDDSMLPLLRLGDQIVVDQSSYARTHIDDGEVIAVRHEDAIVIRRVLALPEESVRGADRTLFRNGQVIAEPYLAKPTDSPATEFGTFEQRVMGPDEIFVVGDNRDVSFDSRVPEYGAIHLSDVVGRYSRTLWHGVPKK